MQMNRRGIVLAGGSGTRLHPLTRGVSKQLMPIYDKPMIFYPLCVLMQAGIREIAIVTMPDQKPLFEALLGDGSQWGCRFVYVEQPRPEGIAQALVLCADFLDGHGAALVLGDNVFYGHGLNDLIAKATERTTGATVFACHVNDPERYGVVSFDATGRAVAIDEKPERPTSPYAVTGLYFFDAEAVAIARDLKPSARGELEITDINRTYLERGQLNVEVLPAGIAWLDTGTHESLFDAATYIRAVQLRQGLMIGCPEETAWRKGYIDDAQLARLAEPLKKNGYGAYLLRLIGRKSCA